MKQVPSFVSALVLAVVLGGCGTGSDPVAPSSVIDNAPPQAPSGLATALNASNVRVLEWAPNPEADLAGYQVYQYSPDPGRDNAYVLVATVSAGTTEWALPVTESMQVTWVRLRALDASGNRSAESAAAQVTLLPGSPGSDPPQDEVNPHRR